MTVFSRTLVAASLIWMVPALGQPVPPAGMMSPETMGGNMRGGAMMERNPGDPTARGPAGFNGMMPMMNMMMGTRSGAAHIEGRLAFVKAELKITDAQAAEWNAFAEATRSNANSMSEIRATMMSRSAAPSTLPDRLALEDKAMTAHLTALKKTEETVAKLYAVLTADQKKIADSIVVGPMGMPMGMM